MNRGATNPPAWAERALMAILPADRAETESGDLLEAYRDEQLPAHGRAAADRWYLRQVVVVFARGYWFWIAALVAQFIASDVGNTWQIGLPGYAGPVAAITLITAASVHGGWRTGTVRGGLLAGGVAAMALWLFMAAWWATTWYPFSLVQQTQPYWLSAWHGDAASGETFAHWIFWDNVGATIVSGVVLNTVGLAMGALGGVVGGSAARRLRRA